MKQQFAYAHSLSPTATPTSGHFSGAPFFTIPAFCVSILFLSPPSAPILFLDSFPTKISQLCGTMDFSILRSLP